MFHPFKSSPVLSPSLCCSPNFQLLSTKRFLRSAMVFKDLSLDLSGHITACGDGRHSPPLLFLVSFSSDGLAVVEELVILCPAKVLSEFSLADSGLFIACDAGSLYPQSLFSFYLVLSSSISLLDGCLAVNQFLFCGYEVGSVGIARALGDMFCWILQMAATPTTTVLRGLASAGVFTLYEGFAIWFIVFGLVSWPLCYFPLLGLYGPTMGM